MIAIEISANEIDIQLMKERIFEAVKIKHDLLNRIKL